MSKKTLFLIGLLILVAGLLGYNYVYQPFAGDLNSQVVDTGPATVEADPVDPVEKLFTHLSDGQRVAQLLAWPVELGPDTESDLMLLATNSAQANLSQLDWIKEYQPGFITIFGDEVERNQVQILNEQLLKADLVADPWLVVDHEGGSVQRLSGAGFSELPSWSELCNQNEATMAANLERSAQELSQSGIKVVLGPVLDFARNHPVLKSRVCSDDPLEVASRSAVAVGVYKTNGILPVLKHFPGIGQTTKDLHQQFDRVEVGPEEASVYLSVLDLYPEIGVMTTHVGVTNQALDLPCSLSKTCVSELTDNFPQVLVFSDALDMKSAAYQAGEASQSATYDKSLAERAIEAIKAGNDVLIFGPQVTDSQMAEVYDRLLSEYQTNNQFRAQLDQHLHQILAHKVANSTSK